MKTKRHLLSIFLSLAFLLASGCVVGPKVGIIPQKERTISLKEKVVSWEEEKVVSSLKIFESNGYLKVPTTINYVSNTPDGGFIVLGTYGWATKALLRFTTERESLNHVIQVFKDSILEVPLLTVNEIENLKIASQDKHNHLFKYFDTKDTTETETHPFILKLKKDYSVDWVKKVGGGEFDAKAGIRAEYTLPTCSLSCVIPTSDGGYIAGGSLSNSKGKDMLVIKFSKSGSVEWSKVISNPSSIGTGFSKISAKFVLEISTDRFLVVVSDFNSYSDKIVEIEKGKIVKSIKIFRVFISALKKTDGNGYVLVGIKDEAGVGKITLIKLSPDLLVEKSITLSGGEGYDRGFDVVEANDGGFVVVGSFSQEEAEPSRFNPERRSLFIGKVSKNFQQLEWANTLKSDRRFYYGDQILLTSDGYIVLGRAESYTNDGTKEDCWGHGCKDVNLFKFSTNGSLVWALTDGGNALCFLGRNGYTPAADLHSIPYTIVPGNNDNFLLFEWAEYLRGPSLAPVNTDKYDIDHLTSTVSRINGKDYAFVLVPGIDYPSQKAIFSEVSSKDGKSHFMYFFNPTVNDIQPQFQEVELAIDDIQLVDKEQSISLSVTPLQWNVINVIEALFRSYEGDAPDAFSLDN